MKPCYSIPQMGVRACFPESWCVRNISADLVVILPKDLADEDFRHARASVSIHRTALQNGDLFDATVQRLMRLRVPQGRVELTPADSKYKNGISTDWSDGIFSLSSTFFRRSDAFIEIVFGVAPDYKNYTLRVLRDLVEIERID